MNRRILWRLSAIVALSVVVVACSDDDGDKPTGEKIVLGAIFHDDVVDSARLRFAGVQLAVEEINAAKVLDREIELVNRTPSKGDAADAERARENVRKLYDEDGAIGVISLFSSLGKAIIEVTNEDAYSDLVQCNCSATNPTLNIPGEADADENDTFYRTVVVDLFQGRLMVQVLQEREWKNVGIYSLEDAFGQGLRKILQDEIATLEGHTLTFDETHPTGDFDASASQATLDSIITKSKTGTLDVLILPTLPAQSPGIVKYLVDNGYQGDILLSDGAKTTNMFQIATGLKAWIGDGHAIIGTEPDNFAGKNSGAFTSAFEARFSEEPNTYSPTAYDCAYAIVFAALYAGRDNYTAKGVKANLGKFKEANRGTEVAVGIGASEFAKAYRQISAGQSVDFEGASGRLLFDANGDRPSQGMRTFTPNEAATDWVVGDKYDAALEKI